jgi:hypothetical protein
MTEEDIPGLSQDECQQVLCPFCGSSATEFFSLFGSQLLTAQYYCRSCHTPFERVKDESVMADAARRDLARSPLRSMYPAPGKDEEQP